MNDNLDELVQHLCTRPEMYVGRLDYELAMTFLHGYLHGTTNGFVQPFIGFLCKKYKKPGNLAFWAYSGAEASGYLNTERPKFVQFLRDYNEFRNPLTRMAVEVQAEQEADGE